MDSRVSGISTVCNTIRLQFIFCCKIISWCQAKVLPLVLFTNFQSFIVKASAPPHRCVGLGLGRCTCFRYFFRYRRQGQVILEDVDVTWHHRFFFSHSSSDDASVPSQPQDQMPNPPPFGEPSQIPAFMCCSHRRSRPDDKSQGLDQVPISDSTSNHDELDNRMTIPSEELPSGCHALHSRLQPFGPHCSLRAYEHISRVRAYDATNRRVGWKRQEPA